MRFERGRAIEITAGSGAELLRELSSRDEGAARLGVVALVGGSGRIGPLNTIFHNTLLDENAVGPSRSATALDFSLSPTIGGPAQ
jgi:aminopeptidase